MKCPKCIEEGLKSLVTPGGGRSTAMYCAPYYDEEGVYHHHDRNTTTSSWSCSNGHKGTTTHVNRCPGCDWVSGTGEMRVRDA